MKTLFLIVLLLVGCAGQRQPEPTYQVPDMKNFIAGCNLARTQIDYLNQEINKYNEYFKNHSPTLEDRRAYGLMKNALWSLRSTCSAKYL